MTREKAGGGGGRSGRADRQAASAATDLALKDSELVTESQNLSLKPGFGPPADQERVEEEANGSVEEGEGHGGEA